MFESVPPSQPRRVPVTSTLPVRALQRGTAGLLPAGLAGLWRAVAAGWALEGCWEAPAGGRPGGTTPGGRTRSVEKAV